MRKLTALVSLVALSACASRADNKPFELREPGAIAPAKNLDSLRAASLGRSTKTLAFESADGRLSGKSAFGAAVEMSNGALALSFRKGQQGAVLGLVEAGRPKAMALAVSDFTLGCEGKSGATCIQRSATSTVVEWWENKVDGLEQSFRLESPSEGTRGALRLRIAIDFATFTVRDDGSAVDVLPVHGPELTYEGLLVKDAGGRVLPARFEAMGSGVDIVFSDVGATYPIVVDPTLKRKETSRTWEGRDTGASGEFGWSVASAGDVNGDGYDDVLVGTGDVRTDRVSYGSYVSGRVFLFLGGPSGPTAASWTVGWNVDKGEEATAIGVGDLNGDGLADVAVFGQFGADAERGRTTSIYLGSKSGLGKSPSVELPGQLAFPVGDVDGDKLADLALVSIERGTVQVRFGGRKGLDNRSLDLTTSAPATEITHGDFDGDGREDVVIGTPTAGKEEEGAFHIYLNGERGLPTVPSQSVFGLEARMHLGASVQSARDVDGDKLADLLVAARYDFVRADGDAFVFLYPGANDGVRTEPSWKLGYLRGLGFRGVQRPSFVTVLAGVGDVDGDGFNDVLIGAPEELNDKGGTGEALLFRGSGSGLGDKPDLVFALPDNAPEIAKNPAIFLGHAVAGAGDVDGDGIADILISADSYSTKGQPSKRGATANGGLVCLNDCNGKRAPDNALPGPVPGSSPKGAGTDAGCVIRSAYARDRDVPPTTACTSCTATQLKGCGGRTGACNVELGGCAPCDANVGERGSAPCRDPKRPVCALTGPSAGACRPACEGDYVPLTTSGCSWLTPICQRSGPELGRCAACSGDFGSGARQPCGAARPVCVRTGAAAGSCIPAPRRESGGTLSLESEALRGFLKRSLRGVQAWWSSL
jgi:hypothetical protein